MNTTRLAPFVFLALPLLGACQRPQATAPASAPAATATAGAADAAPETLLGKTVAKAIAEAKQELETGNLDLRNGVNVQVGEHGRHFQVGGNGRSDGPKAEITPQGDLLVEGKPVAVSPAQRALLLEYRGQVIAVAEAGMAVGVKGADLAGKALGETFNGLLHGNADAAGKRIEAEGEKLKADARRICAQLPGMLQTQQRLAASLPAFAPYATMTREDVDDCMKHDVAVTDAGGPGLPAEVRDEVRNQVRDKVRASIRLDSDEDQSASRDADSAARR